MPLLFPDSGVPPGDARNSLPDVNTAAGCAELWYSTSRCEPRFDPAAANAMLSELFMIMAQGEWQYDCATFNNLQVAIRYISQRNSMCGTFLVGGPNDYTCSMAPALTDYRNYLTFTVIPTVTNTGPVRINIDGKGFVELRRNDGGQLESRDLISAAPFIMSYCNGYWFYVGLCASQVPIIAIYGVDVWIRTDGNDVTGDGSANDPTKAFRTIGGAWDRVVRRYAVTPLFTIRMRLGIPGTYAGAQLGDFGGQIQIIGDQNNRSAYRISSVYMGNNHWGNLMFINTSALLYGITLVRDIGGTGAPPYCVALTVVSSYCLISNTDFDASAGNPVGGFIWVRNGGTALTQKGTYNFYGRAMQIAYLIMATEAGTWQGSIDQIEATIHNYIDCVITGSSFQADLLGIINYSGVLTLNSSGCTGQRYSAQANSIITMRGRTPPGTIAGAVATGGQYIA